MRILFWSETFWPRIGGVENLAARLLPALRRRGHEFVVVTWDNTKVPHETRYQGIPVYRFPFFSAGHDSLGSMIENRREVARLKQRFAPDLVHINSYGRSVLFHLNTTSAQPAPVLVTLHQALPDEPVAHDSLLGHLLRTADWITTCSNAVLAHARELVPEIISSSSVILNGIEITALEPRPIPLDPPRILCLGRLVPEKGFDLALAAFATIRDRFPGLHLIIAGDGPERVRLEQQVVELGLNGVVEFKGWVAPESVPVLMNTATIVVMPSRWQEPFGLVALEAALMARPIVATRVGGLPEVVANERTGLLVEPEDSQALARAITFLLEHLETAKQMGLTARDRAQKELNWQKHVDAYDALYRKLMMDARQRASIGSSSTNRISR